MSGNISPVAWYGGKRRLSSWITSLLPRHDTYIEAFGGGASVLFTKPRARLEIYNDLDDGLVTFFRMLRDRPVELQHVLALTPYARSEFEHCRATWTHMDDELERARRWYARTRMAFAAQPPRAGATSSTAPSAAAPAPARSRPRSRTCTSSRSGSAESSSTSSTGTTVLTATTAQARSSTSTRHITPTPAGAIAATATATTSTPKTTSNYSPG
jgi:hypothetical protein